TRAVRPVAEHSAAGRVIRGGTPGEPHRGEPTEFVRKPKDRHGDPDTPNRAVIRNSLALPVAPPTPPEPAPAAGVVRARRHVEPEPLDHDPGPYLTNYNLGRGQ
ncbi:MAG TPA: hypothetical protein VE172_09020, partial [Stackebrandtia sp.]